MSASFLFAEHRQLHFEWAGMNQSVAEQGKQRIKQIKKDVHFSAATATANKC